MRSLPRPASRRGRRARPRALRVKSLASGVLPDRLGTDSARLQLGEKPVDDARLTRLVVQRLSDDAARQIDRQATHLGPQRDHSLLALGLDLLLRRLGDAVGLGLRLGTQVRNDRGALLLGLLADVTCLGASLGKLGLVLLESRLRLLLRLLGLVHTAFDGRSAVRIRPVSYTHLTLPTNREV